jgi:hypothetical protein
MDIDGAKALKERLARTAWAKTRHASVEVPDDAPPVYRWFSASANADGGSADALPADDGTLTLGPLGLPPAS